VLYAFVGGFACCDGAGPTANMIQASDGNFYGTTVARGAFRNIHHQGGFGTVLQFNPVSGAVTILHSFIVLAIVAGILVARHLKTAAALFGGP
jgi:uncharacterized repeat protein (TIGR03803 family)